MLKMTRLPDMLTFKKNDDNSVVVKFGVGRDIDESLN